MTLRRHLQGSVKVESVKVESVKVESVKGRWDLVAVEWWWDTDPS